jgi:rod shape-determining protein MreD
MEESLGPRLGRYLRTASPVLAILLGILLLKLPFGLPGISSLATVFALCSVYYWALYRPDLLPVGMSFLIGFFLDILSTGPFGVHCLVLLMAHGLTLSQRRFLAGKATWVIWLGQIVIATASVLVFWLVHSIYYLEIMDLAPAFIQLALMIILYPVVAELFSAARIRFMKV